MPRPLSLGVLPLALVLVLLASPLGSARIEARRARAAAEWRALERADHLDLAVELAPAERERLLDRVGDELVRASPSGEARTSVLACARSSERCAEARLTLGHLRASAEEEHRFWTRVLQALWLGLTLLALVVGGVLARQHHGRARALALAALLLLLGGGVWRIWDAQAGGRAALDEARLDRLVTRARVALELAPAARDRALQEIVDEISRLRSTTSAAGEALVRTARACTGRPRCGEVLVPLARIYSAFRPAPARPAGHGWAARWLLWIGAVFLLLLPLLRGRDDAD